jgi:hypothetical protein
MKERYIHIVLIILFIIIVCLYEFSGDSVPVQSTEGKEGGEGKEDNEVPLRPPQLNGAETVWIWFEEEIPIILRCDLNLLRDSKIIPEFNAQKLKGYVLPSDENIAFFTTFEYRPQKPEESQQPQKISFSVLTQSGFIVGFNNNPTETTSPLDWGAWATKHQENPRLYTSNEYPIEKKNVFMIKWYNTINYPFFRCILNFANNPYKDIYPTQDIRAPWLQYEMCRKKNKLGFYEKRWGGSCAIRDGQPVYSFDTVHSGVVFDSSELPHMSFISTSRWSTKARFGFTAFKAITLLVRPKVFIASKAAISPDEAGIFNFGETSLSLLYAKGKYAFYFSALGNHITLNCLINEWNYIAIQYIGDINGVRTFSCISMGYDELCKDVNRQKEFCKLSGQVDNTGAYVFPYINTPSKSKFSDKLCLGSYSVSEGSAVPGVSTHVPGGTGGRIGNSFTGDIRWLHGFRDYIDPYILSNDLQGWSKPSL